jgi:hypothetical protein
MARLVVRALKARPIPASISQAGHRGDYRSGLQPSNRFYLRTWGYAPCWYSVAPSALHRFSNP